MNEKFITRNGVTICSESFGDATNPPVLLMMGATASMLWWETDFCRQLADAGLFVIRYDNRDTGKSTTYEPGTSNYTIEDLAADALAVLDDYGLIKAHLFGMSLGGYLAQLIGLKYPERVASLILIMSEPLGEEVTDVPPMDERILQHHEKAASLDWTDEAAAANFMADGWELLAGSRHVFNKARTLATATAEIKRATNLLSAFNHARLTGGEEYAGRLKELAVPTLIIHGTEDKVLPFAHAKALHRSISNSELFILQGAGHELHENDWPLVIEKVVAHVAAATDK